MDAFYFSVNGDKSDVGNPKQAIAALPLSLADCDAKNITTHWFVMVGENYV